MDGDLYMTILANFSISYMDAEGGHPACPSDGHLRSFVEHLKIKDNRPTVRQPSEVTSSPP